MMKKILFSLVLSVFFAGAVNVAHAAAAAPVAIKAAPVTAVDAVRAPTSVKSLTVQPGQPTASVGCYDAGGSNTWISCKNCSYSACAGAGCAWGGLGGCQNQ